MKKNNFSLTIGLFGTCGNTSFRKDIFIPEFEKREIEFFNPQVDNWSEEMAEIEAEHLAKDGVILFPVTDETYSLGSLAEVGFSILNAIKLDDRRDFVIMIDSKLEDALMENKILSKESLRQRALVKQHLYKLSFPNVYLVDSLTEMCALGIALIAARERVSSWEKYSLKNIDK